MPLALSKQVLARLDRAGFVVVDFSDSRMFVRNVGKSTTWGRLSIRSSEAEGIVPPVSDNEGVILGLHDDIDFSRPADVEWALADIWCALEFLEDSGEPCETCHGGAMASDASRSKGPRACRSCGGEGWVL